VEAIGVTISKRCTWPKRCNYERRMIRLSTLRN